LQTAGYALGVKDLVARRAAQAKAFGMDGLILSAEELIATRQTLGQDLILVTPGIRPAGAETGDQKRVMTPAAAIAAGADYLVIGRPIIAAADPAIAAKSILEEITQAL
jgi:orotidine-5'-phosphate decarboxylase